MKKRIINMMLALLVLLSFSACNNDTASENESNPSVITDTENSKQSETQQATQSTQSSETQKPTQNIKPTITEESKVETSSNRKPTVCNHVWKSATCTAPKTCSKCGVTEGNANGHSWIDATFTAPKTCSTCHTTEGSALTRETEEITITAENWSEYFEVKRKDIIPEINAFGEYGTPEDMHYRLELVLKKEYLKALVSIDVSIELMRDTYLKSYNYDKSTGIGTITEEYRQPYNNTDTSLCNLKDSEAALICVCHHAGSTEIGEKIVYYGYICESLKCTRAAGTIVIQK